MRHGQTMATRPGRLTPDDDEHAPRRPVFAELLEEAARAALEQRAPTTVGERPAQAPRPLYAFD